MSGNTTYYIEDVENKQLSLIPLALPPNPSKQHNLDFSKQRKQVFDVCQDGIWRSLETIQTDIYAQSGKYVSQTGISARLREFRHDPAWKMEKRSENGRLFVYRLVRR